MPTPLSSQECSHVCSGDKESRPQTPEPPDVTALIDIFYGAESPQDSELTEFELGYAIFACLRVLGHNNMNLWAWAERRAILLQYGRALKAECAARRTAARLLGDRPRSPTDSDEEDVLARSDSRSWENASATSGAWDYLPHRASAEARNAGEVWEVPMKDKPGQDVDAVENCAPGGLVAAALAATSSASPSTSADPEAENGMMPKLPPDVEANIQRELQWQERALRREAVVALQKRGLDAARPRAIEHAVGGDRTAR